MATVKLSKTTIEFSRKGKGLPLILLHGFPLDNRIWERVFPILENEFDVVMPNLRGFGNSITDSSSFALSDMAEDIAELMDGLGIERGIFAGHSMGGYVALSFAQSFPGRLLGLGLISTQSSADSPEKKASRYQTAAQVEERGVVILAESMSDKLVADNELQKMVSEIIMTQPKSGILGAIRALAERQDHTPTLGTLNCPISIIHGDADLLIPVERAVEMNALCRKSTLTILEGIGHLPMLEKPSETSAALIKLKESGD